jgi:hypothetical protein
MLKLIYWVESTLPKGHPTQLATVHILKRFFGNKYPPMTEYIDVIEELKKTFPQATEDAIFPSTINVSKEYLKLPPLPPIHGDHVLIRWHAIIPRNEYPGWEQFEGKPKY